MNLTRLIIDPPSGGSWNMARDEAMLLAAAHRNERILRFYRWDRPTLSLGYFQQAAARDEHPASRNCPLIRRATGGGAIVHDRELTYSFAAPSGDRLARRVTKLYDAFHESLVEVLGGWGIRASLVEHPRSDKVDSPFLCFRRRSRGDVVLDGEKVAGSAQRRQHGAVLQHGSVLLRRSPCAPELPGLQDLSGSVIQVDDLIEAWTAALCRTLPLSMERSGWEEVERRDAERIASDRYQATRWTARR